MRIIVAGMVIVGGLAFVGIQASAGPLTPGATPDVENSVVQVQSSYCSRLRRRCENKEERGEVGEGNCRRYREECGGGGRCESLRRACENKEARGEVGEGNCRRYRQECGSRMR
jgi:hypothetical protein